MTASDPVVWGAVLFAGVGTYAFRASFLFLFERIENIPQRVETSLDMVPVAVLSALVVPAVFAPGDTIAILGNDRLPAALVAGVVAWYTENILATIVVGLVVLVLIGVV